MILYGIKTILNNQFFRLVSKENQFSLIFEGTICPYLDFKKYAEGIFVKQINKSDILNAFSYQTLAKYKNYIFQIDKIKEKKVLITTSEKVAFDELKLDFVDRGWYEKWVDVSELDEIWEERIPTDLGFPYPEGLPNKEEIKLK